MWALVVRILQVSSLPDYGPDNIARLVSHFTPETVAEAIDRNNMILAESNGRMLATASLGGTAADPQAYALRTFFVDPDAQGMGIGSRLLPQLEAHARDLGVTALPVRSSISGMPFYEARGFEVVDEVWDGDALTFQMSKTLI
ncbi:GNAT family N-acetyltransferase [Flavimaricola marinus]|uniref:Acetyltransferase (GNAT) family protein n=1 Tax=Flavimaricola marinus TaxID=1819565 RepID=A0A238LEH1_9RHOB|nr:GNAT family N-acetyltransferase [Flavimaricola marinus]SMY08107.1 Acetyltransferase (GNAT) family protein [Flavimaricola marinus]